MYKGFCALVLNVVTDTLTHKALRHICASVAEVKGKIDAKQTERVVINLKNWDGEISNLQKQFTDYPVENLKELMIIDKNNVVSHIEL